MMLRSVRAAPATVNLKLRITHRSEACPPTTPMMGPSYAALIQLQSLRLPAVEDHFVMVVAYPIRQWRPHHSNADF